MKKKNKYFTPCPYASKWTEEEMWNGANEGENENENKTKTKKLHSLSS
jgi:hypothetical protein